MSPQTHSLMYALNDALHMFLTKGNVGKRFTRKSAQKMKIGKSTEEISNRQNLLAAHRHFGVARNKDVPCSTQDFFPLPSLPCPKCPFPLIHLNQHPFF